MTPALRPAPTVDADNAPFWQGARDGELRLQRCADCALPRFYPRRLCPQCWSDDVEWFTAAGRGIVYSYTVVERASSPEFHDAVPYVVALVDLVEGPRMMCTVESDDPGSVGIGDRVHIRFDPTEKGWAVPVFVKDAS